MCMKGVFTFLVDHLGVKDVQFEELISLDAGYLGQLRFADRGKDFYSTIGR